MWIKSRDLFKELKSNNSPFEVILIGLNGGIKPHNTGPVKLNDLFGRFNALPMRRSEIDNIPTNKLYQIRMGNFN